MSAAPESAPQVPNEAPVAKAATKVKTSADQPSGKPAKPAEMPRSAVELRGQRRRILQRRFAIWVGVPTLLSIVYYVAIASAQYDARITLAVESNEGRVGGEASGKAATTGNQRDARLLSNALRGDHALAALDHGHAFHNHYARKGNWFSALAADADKSATLDYYRDKVVTAYDVGTNIVTVRVRAFTGETAHDFAVKLVAFAETWVADQNKASSKARLELASAEVERARQRIAELTPPASTATDATVPQSRSIDQQIAEKRLEAALEGEQQAELDVGRAQRYLVVLDGPSEPDAATLPRRAWGISTVFVGALVLVSVLSLLGAAVREHAKF